MVISPRTNTVDTAYTQLRDRLIAFQIKPGMRLNESEIAADLAMSRAPVREALNRLIADGLVRFEAGRGFFCRRLSASEMTDLYAVRYDLEAGALTAALAQATDAALAGFGDTWRVALAHAQEMTLEALVQADEGFHLDLAALAPNDPRQSFLNNINDRIRFVRRINLEPPRRRASAFEEHAQLIDAVIARDSPSALGILRRHLERSADEVRMQVGNALAEIYAEDVI